MDAALSKLLSGIKADIDAYVASVDQPPAPPAPPPPVTPAPTPTPQPPAPPMPMTTEMEAVMALVDESLVTHEAIGSVGNWSDPLMWAKGLVPGDSARACVPAGTIMLQDVDTGRLKSLCLEGKLVNHDGAKLNVETLVINPSGVMSVGDRFACTFLDLGPLDPITDPRQLGRGLINMGKFSVAGAAKTPWAWLTKVANAGDTAIAVDTTGWQKGDWLAIADHVRGTHEVVQIADAMPGSALLVKPLGVSHVSNIRGQLPFVQNLTLSITFRSENKANRGHCMFMSPDTDIRYAGFYDLGRTDKSRQVTDADGSGAGLDNPRGRYPLHLHKMAPDGPLANVEGCVVWGSPGWGIVNHSSNATIKNCCTFDVDGAHLVCEAGDENGSFVNCSTLYSKGSGSMNAGDRRKNNDAAHQGVGLWIEGGGIIEDTNNVHSGHAFEGIVYTGDLLAQRSIEKVWKAWGIEDWKVASIRTRFPDGVARTQSGDFPLQIKGTVCFGNGYGSLMLWQFRSGTELGSYPPLGTIEDCAFHDYVHDAYGQFIEWINTKLLGSFGHSGVLHHQIHRNSTIDGTFYTGTQGRLDFIGGKVLPGGIIKIQNIPSDVGTAFELPRQLVFDGTMQFGDGASLQLIPDYTHFDFTTILTQPGAARIWEPYALGTDEIRWGDEYLFFPEQHPSHSLADWTGLPPEQRTTVGDNNAAGRFVGARKIPDNATRIPFGNGWWSKQPAVRQP